ncbi:MAG: lactate utilization protein [Pelovirga sp.]
MAGNNLVRNFNESAERVGASVKSCATLTDAAAHIAGAMTGKALVPLTALAEKYQLPGMLVAAGVEVFSGNFRDAGQLPDAGVTFCNFAMADTGTVVLESTDEDVRLATTIPEIHFVILDPAKIITDNLAAAQPLQKMFKQSEACFIAYITGPSRTADIERVLTIGCHGPRELHILLVPDVSEDLMEI